MCHTRTENPPSFLNCSLNTPATLKIQHLSIFVPAASPIDLECHIQCERISKILDDAIYKCKLSICLADLVQEYRLLNSVLSPTHMDDLVFIFEQYDNPLVSASLLDVAVLEELKAVSFGFKF